MRDEIVVDQVGQLPSSFARSQLTGRPYPLDRVFFGWKVAKVDICPVNGLLKLETSTLDARLSNHAFQSQQ